MSEQKIELISDPDLYLFWESMLRGGVTFVGERYARANHLDIEDFDQQKPGCHIMDVDANNLVSL